MSERVWDDILIVGTYVVFMLITAIIMMWPHKPAERPCGCPVYGSHGK